MKKILSTILILTILVGLNPLDTFGVAKTKDENYFIVTAYYSPLPDQKYYLKGNYEDEKKLNGNGIRGASGKEVFSGMLAAPKDYSFGTKIYLEGLGVGSVEDRGGAIVNAGERGYKHDRIDVWMGYGEEGLKRALFWGKRKVKGYIVDDNAKTNIDINSLSSPDFVAKNLNKIPDIFYESIGKNSKESSIRNLQEFFSELGLYSSDINGAYNSEIINLVYDFQVNNDIVSSEYDLGAGYWGVKTRELFFKKYLDGEVFIENKDSIEEKYNNDIFSRALSGEGDIKSLQSILKDIGFYEGELDGDYKNISDIILNFQLDNDIIKNNRDIGASYFGPKTRKTLKIFYDDYLVKKQEKEEFEKQIVEIESLALEKSKEQVETIGNPKLGDISKEVRSLQLLLSSIGYFDYKDTAIFGEITKESIIKFQIENAIVSSDIDVGAGVFGPKTKETLIEKNKDIIFKELIKDDIDLRNYIASKNGEKEVNLVNETIIEKI